MSDLSDGGTPGQTSIQARSAELDRFADHSMSPAQARQAVLIDLETLSTLKGQDRSTALGTMGRMAESQRPYAEALDRSNPFVSDQALTAAGRQSADIVRAQAEHRQTDEGRAGAPQADRLREAVRRAELEHDGQRAGRSYAELGPAAVERPPSADARTLKDIEGRHDGLQALPIGALGAAAASEAVAHDAAAMDSLQDKAMQGRAALALGETADLQPAYKAALQQASPALAGQAGHALAEDQVLSAAKEARKATEFAERRDGAAQDITTRYAKMLDAGLTVKDLQEPALRRLATLDSRDLLLLDGQPAHTRQGEARALVADSLKSEAYRKTFDRETAEWSLPKAGRRPELAAAAGAALSSPECAPGVLAAPSNPKQPPKDLAAPDLVGIDANSMRSGGSTTAKRRAVPPLEDRFNVFRVGLVEKEYHFRDQAGKVAFTDRFLSISTASESPAAIKAMVDRAGERGWDTVNLKGSPEFVRQGWIAASAQGLKAVGHTPTPGDREAVIKERERLQAGRAVDAPQRSVEDPARASTAQAARADASRNPADPGGARQLAAAIEKALVEGKVSPEIRGQVRDLMAAEGARRLAGGERFKLPVYDARAPRARSQAAPSSAPRLGDRERSR